MIDGIYLHQVINSLSHILIGTRIEKVYHPNEKMLIFKIKGTNTKFGKLLISVDPAFCSVHLSTLSVDNPEQPTSFCMLLRKHIEGGLIKNVSQYGYERLVDIDIESYNELGEKTLKTIHLELMGKYSNVVLTENNMIIDALYKYPIGVNGLREILSKRKYFIPPLVEKVILEEIEQNKLDQFLDVEDNKEESLSSFLQKHLQGFSKTTISKLLKDLGMDNFAVCDLTTAGIKLLIDRFHEYAKMINIRNDEILEDLDSKFNSYYLNNRISAKKAKLNGFVAKYLKKLEKKAAIYQDKILLAENCDLLRIKGEILSANLYRLKEKSPYIVLENYYDDESRPIKIELDESLSPAQNVKKYFKKYYKIKEGKKQSEHLLEDANNEIDYINSIKESISSAIDQADLSEIEDELSSIGLMKASSKKRKRNVELNYSKVILENGDLIYVGKNNKQNDFITFKLAGNKDIWFHIKDYPGPHVILKYAGDSAVESSILKAAEYAAGRAKIGKVQVDYSYKKNVKKHPSLKLGKVIYTDYSTITIKKEDE